MLKWKDLLVIGKVLALKLLEIVRAAGAIDLLEMVSFAGNLPGFSYRIAENWQSCWSYQNGAIYIVLLVIRKALAIEVLEIDRVAGAIKMVEYI